MIIYNVTINIEEAATAEWLAWMQETHIPDVIATGKFAGKFVAFRTELEVISNH